MRFLFDCCLCKKKRRVDCHTPCDYYNRSERRRKPSCRGDYLNDYPGLVNRDLQNGYHKFD